MNQQNHIQPTRFNELVEDRLSNAERLQIESHLDSCGSCRMELEKMVADQSEWEQAGEYLSESAELQPADWMVSTETVSIELAADGSQVRSPIHVEDVKLEAAFHPENLGRIDAFEIEKEIGRGGCGVVYKGFDRELNRPVAIKVLAPHLASSGIARKRFAREARAAAAVVHPNVVPIHSVSPGPDRPYMVMRLVNGRSLEAHVREKGPLELKDIVRIAQQIAAGLSAAHRQGLIHRDIKPANILLEQDVSRVMITDFGLARASDDAALTQTGWLAGTPHYMSPEQAQGAPIDQRSDLFSLGSLIYFMATGREPFRAEKPFAVIQKIINEKPTRVREINSDVSKTLAHIIERLLAKCPKDRFRSAEELQQTLEQYLAHLQNPLASPKPKLVRPKSRFRTAVLIGTALVLFGCWSLQQLPTRLQTPFPTEEVKSPVDLIASAASELGSDTVLPEVGLTNSASPTTNEKTGEQVWSDQTFDAELQKLERELKQLEFEFSATE